MLALDLVNLGALRESDGIFGIEPHCLVEALNDAVVLTSFPIGHIPVV